MEPLKKDLQYNNFCIAVDEVFPPHNSEEAFANIVPRLVDYKPKAGVVVLITTEKTIPDFFEEASAANLTGITWIASETWATTKTIAEQHVHAAQGFLGLTLDAPKPIHFQ
ncbi:PREDICTED: taste receptor type 1 member 2-like [Priapulus caudatus]|uniref:Taste receptor type 1 member 2-like n=1 Tax=Priapulus caudatus TaxID=37621 RepID=A0ABM1E776_PRICU|nr:PREDICTED: taste receptor type 1 member 2-like [Priapulus caudatus]